MNDETKTPPPCWSCGCPVEVDWSFSSEMPTVIDRRFAEFFPPHTMVVAPILCWTCRGVVLLDRLPELSGRPPGPPMPFMPPDSHI